MKPSFWCPLNPLDRVSGPVRSHLLLQSFFFPFIFIFFEVNLSSFMWFLTSPGEALADSYLVLLGPPFSPGSSADAVRRWRELRRCSPAVRDSDPGGCASSTSGPLWSGGTGPTLCSCFFTPFLVFDPFIFNHGTESTCRAPPPPDNQHDLCGTAQTSLETRLGLTELGCLPVVCTCAPVSVCVGPLQTSATTSVCFWVLEFLEPSPRVLADKDVALRVNLDTTGRTALTRPRGGSVHVIVWTNPQRHCWNSMWSQRSPTSALDADRDRILLRAERGNPPLDWTWNGFYTKAQQEVDRRQLFSTFVDLSHFFCQSPV